MTEIAAVMDRLPIDLHDHVASPETSLLGATALFHRTHQHTFTVLCSKKVAQLGRQVLHHQATAHRRVHHHNRDRHIDIRHNWHDRHVELEFLAVRTKIVSEILLAIRQFRLHGHHLAIAADSEAYRSPGRDFADHAAQLLHTLHLAAIQSNDDVV